MSEITFNRNHPRESFRVRNELATIYRKLAWWLDNGGVFDADTLDVKMVAFTDESARTLARLKAVLDSEQNITST